MENKTEVVKEGFLHHLPLRILAAACTSLVVLYSVFLCYLFFTNPLEASIFLFPSVSSLDMEKQVSSSPDHNPLNGSLIWYLPIALILPFVSFYFMRFGSPQGGSISAFEAINDPRGLFAKIRGGLFSLRGLVPVLLVISAAYALASTAFDYLWFEASLGPLKEVSLPDLSTATVFPSGLVWALRFVLSALQYLVFSFAAPYALYWLIKAFRGKADYLNLYALTVHLSIISIAFALSSSAVGLLSFVLVGKIPLLNLTLFPYLGDLAVCFALVYGVKAASGLSLRKSLAVAVPFVAFALASMYLRYVLVYWVSEKIFQITLLQLGFIGN